MTPHVDFDSDHIGYSLDQWSAVHQVEGSIFNGHYDTWCYLPLLAFVTFNDEPEQYLCAAILRPGDAPVSLGTIGVLRRLMPRLRVAFPKARLRVRLDGGFATPEVFEWLEAERLEYVVAMRWARTRY